MSYTMTKRGPTTPFERFINTRLVGNTYWKAQSLGLTVYFNSLIDLNRGIDVLEGIGARVVRVHSLRIFTQNGKYLVEVRLPHGIKTIAMRNKLSKAGGAAA